MRPYYFNNERIESNKEPRSLEQIRELLRSTDPSLAYKSLPLRRSSSFASPHSCVHCKKIVVDSDCFSVKELVYLGEGRYFRETSSSFKLEYGLDEAVAASREGCYLYEWFLDNLSVDLAQLYTTGLVYDRIDFHLTFETDGAINCGPVIDAVCKGGKSRRLVNKAVVGEPWSRLSICAPRGMSKQ
jgi:hypothetical protein